MQDLESCLIGAEQKRGDIICVCVMCAFMRQSGKGQSSPYRLYLELPLCPLKRYTAMHAAFFLCRGGHLLFHFRYALSDHIKSFSNHLHVGPILQIPATSVLKPHLFEHLFIVFFPPPSKQLKIY